jgi:transcriptional regulator GlxA family with amidase domain
MNNLPWTPDRSLMRSGFGSKQGREPASQDPQLLRRLLRAKDRMDAASHEEWPVPRLARVSGVSEAHFARSFKEAFGVPPHRYLLTRRLERATALLHDTNLSIIEIAFQAGWNSLGTSGARSATSPARARVSSVRARKPLRISPSRCRHAFSAPPTDPVSQSQFRRSGGRTKPVA